MGCRAKQKAVTEAEFSVPTLKCEGCAGKLKTALEAVAGVQGVQVKVAEKRVAVSFAVEEASVQQLRETIGKAGFEVAA